MDPKLIEILICPITAKRLRLSKDKKLLVTIDEKLAYPIIDGIPRLSPEDVIDDFKTIYFVKIKLVIVKFRKLIKRKIY